MFVGPLISAALTEALGYYYLNTILGKCSVWSVGSNFLSDYLTLLSLYVFYHGYFDIHCYGL